MGNVISWLFRDRPGGANPTLEEIEARQKARRAQEEAEAAAQAARDLAAEIQRKADEDQEKAQLRREDADRAAAQAAEEMAQMRAQMAEATNAAKRGQELVEEMMQMKAQMMEAANAAKASKEDAERLAQEAREVQQRAQKMRDDAEKAMEAAKEEAERARQAVDEQRREAMAARALAEEISRTVAEETRKANEARLDAERRLREGIRPVVMPSPEEVAAAKERIQYREGYFHFAIAGISGSGKSSLVNAFRGLRSQDVGAATTGVTETTLKITRYHDEYPDNPYVWYDIPGAGTFKCSDWQYFNDQGLYVFDCIIILFDNRFTATDLAILANARRFRIPTYIVRSKADQHIRNLMLEMGYDSDGDGNEGIKRQLYKTAQELFIERTEMSVRDNLDDANFPYQRVYIVSSSSLLSIVTSNKPKKMINELELLNDLGNEAYARRRTRSVVG